MKRLGNINLYWYVNILKSQHLSDSLQVRGTPGSGKTVLSWLLAWHIYQHDQTAHVIFVSGWDLDHVRRLGGWKLYLQHEKGWDEENKTVLIFDEAEATYGDSDLWLQFFIHVEDYQNQSVIVFSGHGSPTSQLRVSDTNTPWSVGDLQRVTLHRGDGPGAVGLLFTRAEFNDFINKRFPSPEFRFHPTFYDSVFDITGGHVGAICGFLGVIIAHSVSFSVTLEHIMTSYLSIIVNSSMPPTNVTRGIIFWKESDRNTYLMHLQQAGTYSQGGYLLMKTFGILPPLSSSPTSFVTVQLFNLTP